MLKEGFQPRRSGVLKYLKSADSCMFLFELQRIPGPPPKGDSLKVTDVRQTEERHAERLHNVHERKGKIEAEIGMVKQKFDDCSRRLNVLRKKAGELPGEMTAKHTELAAAAWAAINSAGDLDSAQQRVKDREEDLDLKRLYLRNLRERKAAGEKIADKIGMTEKGIGLLEREFEELRSALPEREKQVARARAAKERITAEAEEIAAKAEEVQKEMGTMAVERERLRKELIYELLPRLENAKAEIRDESHFLLNLPEDNSGMVKSEAEKLKAFWLDFKAEIEGAKKF